MTLCNIPAITYQAITYALKLCNIPAITYQ